MQLAARTPTATAMAAITLDHISNGRFQLGLGVSGPQVVEGWYGRPSNKPLARTREYVEIIRRVLRREEPLDFQGEFYQHPYHGAGQRRAGQAAARRSPIRCARDLPIYLGAEGPKNVAMAAEIADGWLPLYYSPLHPEVYAESLAGAEPDFDIVAGAQVNINDDLEAGPGAGEDDARLLHRRHGRQGAELPHQAHGAVRLRGGGAEDPGAVLRGPRDEAIAAVPDEFADAISLCGPPERIRDRLAAWDESPVSTLLVYSPGVEGLRTIAELVLG